MTVRLVSTSQAEGMIVAAGLATGATAASFTVTWAGRSGNAPVGSDKFAIENLLAWNRTQPNVASVVQLYRQYEQFTWLCHPAGSLSVTVHQRDAHGMKWRNEFF
jgi:hypothetical protein